MNLFANFFGYCHKLIAATFAEIANTKARKTIAKNMNIMNLQFNENFSNRINEQNSVGSRQVPNASRPRINSSSELPVSDSSPASLLQPLAFSEQFSFSALMTAGSGTSDEQISFLSARQLNPLKRKRSSTGAQPHSGAATQQQLNAAAADSTASSTRAPSSNVPPVTPANFSLMDSSAQSASPLKQDPSLIAQATPQQVAVGATAKQSASAHSSDAVLPQPLNERGSSASVVATLFPQHWSDPITGPALIDQQQMTFNDLQSQEHL